MSNMLPILTTRTPTGDTGTSRYLTQASGACKVRRMIDDGTNEWQHPRLAPACAECGVLLAHDFIERHHKWHDDLSKKISMANIGMGGMFGALK